MSLPVIGFMLALLLNDEPKSFVGTDQYATRTLQGWTVHINKKLLAERKQIGEPAIALLDKKLTEIASTIPPEALKRLREIPIWLGLDDGHAPCAEYHPSRQWLVDHGYNPDKARSVEIGNAQRFVEWSKNQPSMILHELAHGYHDRALTRDETAAVERAYHRAVASKNYEVVRRNNGNNERHYALTNPQEFFAELTESYFGRNDFAPFDRDELETFDPESAALLARLWKLATKS